MVKKFWKKAQIVLVAVLIGMQFNLMALAAEGDLSPAAVGWGNLLIPGLGATLRGEPARGLIEAGVELGTYYGGTFGVREGGFTIDGTVKQPSSSQLLAPLLGATFQEFGLKLHMYNTFYNYQKVCLEQKETEREKNNRQPLYKGNWDDVLFAPFKWKNLSNDWVYPMIIGSIGFLTYNYIHTSVNKVNFQTDRTNDALYGFYNVTAMPLGSSFGEEALFRGFVQRELRLYTNSPVLAIAGETAIFTLAHPNEIKSTGFLSGIYYGIMVNRFDGDLEPGIAAHFWVNVIFGVTQYFTFRRAQGKPAPFAAPISTTINIPF